MNPESYHNSKTKPIQTFSTPVHSLLLSMYLELEFLGYVLFKYSALVDTASFPKCLS